MTRNAIRGGREGGFSLLELLLTILVIGIVSGFAIYSFNNVLPTLRSDSALQFLVAQLRQTRQSALDQRRNFTVNFLGTNELRVERNELCATPPCTVSLVADYFLPYNMTYMLFPSLPDTPDGFGTAQAVGFNGSATTIIFQGDGTVVDASGLFANGTVFIGRAGNSATARAVTVMGATGRVRGYRFDGTAFH
jgi:prepilin-type N-terminal cleavage/methylation domain-containing protein